MGFPGDICEEDIPVHQANPLDLAERTGRDLQLCLGWDRYFEQPAECAPEDESPFEIHPLAKIIENDIAQFGNELFVMNYEQRLCELTNTHWTWIRSVLDPFLDANRFNTVRRQIVMTRRYQDNAVRRQAAIERGPEPEDPDLFL